ncbi:MAG: MBL fold metallo-hydrolase [Arcobacter sp.]|uniref:MBL fold metallo-hydrolase n=1 Tax=Arcobacter sp. TaxID=1872629 RepID=UPI003B00A4EA
MIKKVIVLLSVLSSLLFADIYALKPIKITDDISCVIGDINPPNKQNNGFVSNMCYVNMGNSLVVLDAGPTYIFAKEFHKLMKKEYPNKKISHVVLSNYHDDRIQGASYFKELGAKILGHKTINDDIKQNPSKFERMKAMLPKEIYQKTEVINADTLVGGGYKIKGSKKTLEIIKPSKVSEEKSDIAVYSKDDSFLFVGNMVFNGRLLSYKKTSNIDGWIEALENLAKIKAKYLLGGHGKNFDKDSYKASLEYLKILRNDVKKAYEEEIDIFEVKNHVKTNKFDYLKHFEQLNSANISTYYNQLEWE